MRRERKNILVECYLLRLLYTQSPRNEAQKDWSRLPLREDEPSKSAGRGEAPVTAVQGIVYHAGEREGQDDFAFPAVSTPSDPWS